LPRKSQVVTTRRLIVCEKTSHWATALRLALSNSPARAKQQPRVIETRSLAGSETVLTESPASLVALEVTTANVENVVRFIIRSKERFPAAAPVALLAVDAAGVELLVREAGAIDAIRTVLDAQRLARLALRQCMLAPQPEIGLHELVAERMPWLAHATK
jgi:hypothetical protein